MITNNVMKQIVALSNKPNVFERGTGNIWTEEYIAKQMLKEIKHQTEHREI